jgi:membrane associated rhomboid family serine protease
MNEAAVGHQCPECVAEGRRTQRQGRTTFGGTLAGANGYVTKALVGINVLVMLYVTAVDGVGALFGGGGFGGLMGSVTRADLYGALIPAPTRFISIVGGAQQTVYETQGVVGGDFYRVVTSMFLHYGLLHLLTNMWALWVLGRSLEAVLGPVRFLVLYLVSGLGGAVAVLFFSEPHSLSAGASGAIFGLFAALFIVLRRLGRDTSSVIPLLVINIAISFVPGISLADHLGGLVTGGVVAFALAYAPLRSRSKIQLAGVAAVVLFIIGLGIVALNGLLDVPLELVRFS